MEAEAPFEFVDYKSTGGVTPLAQHVYKILFLDNRYGEGAVNNLRSLFRMRVKKAEVLGVTFGFNRSPNGTTPSINGWERL